MGSSVGSEMSIGRSPRGWVWIGYHMSKHLAAIHHQCTGQSVSKSMRIGMIMGEETILLEACREQITNSNDLNEKYW